MYRTRCIVGEVRVGGNPRGGEVDMRGRWCALLLVSSLILAACQGGDDQGSDEGHGYEDGDQVTLVVPYDAGGGFDTYARTLQPCIESALAEATGADVTVIVENVAGAAGRVGVEDVSRAEPDGLRLVIAAVDIMAAQQALEGAEFDATEMRSVGQVADLSRSLVMREGVITPEDGTFLDLIERSQETPILWGSAGLATQEQLVLLILEEAGLPLAIDPVEFEGTGDAVASLLRNELEVYGVTSETAVQVQDANPELRILVTFGPPAFEGGPSIHDLDLDVADDIELAMGHSRRVIMAPAGTPDATVDVLRQAVETATSGGECVEQSEQAGNVVTFLSGDEVEQLIEDTVELFASRADDLQ
jgi:tripartite-type tricarboxylate transporter receptor subunit TctC